MYDLVIRDALVIDGTGRTGFTADVGIEAGRVAEVANRIEAAGRVEESGSGQVLSPGFIDVHSHDDFAALHTPELPWKALQGVTTEVVGNCGIGVAPFPGAEDWFEKLHPGIERPRHKDYRGYFDSLAEQPASLNLAVLAGHGALRNAAAPGVLEPLDRTEIKRTIAFLDEALDAGVIGLSLGLIYEPGVRASKKELIEVTRRLRGRAPLLTVHLRSEADELLGAVTEAIEIASEAEVGLQLSHHKAHGRNNWGKVVESLALIERSRSAGLDVWVDQYPYTAGSTILSAVMERGGLSGGAALGELHPEDIVIASTSADPEWEGRSLADLSRLFGQSPEHAAKQVLEADPGVWVVVHAMAEEDVKTVLADAHTLVGSDGLPTAGGRPHPRLWGTFPRILGHYVRNESLVGLEEMIAKMTGRAAKRFGLAARGTIEVGNWADLVLFDADKIDPGATFENPTLPPVGIRGVWVNGVLTVRDGEHTGARRGRTIRRAAAAKALS